MKDDVYLLYTLEEGGILHARKSSVLEYEDAKANRRLNVTPVDVDGEKAQYLVPALVVLVKVEKHHDFVLANLTGTGDRDKKGVA